jgi:anaerobic ribonucleoside-triphosphate reductase activating protein
MSVAEIVSRIPVHSVIGISVSGGEPFEQPQGLRELLDAARSLGLHTLVYSGFTYEELHRSFPALLRKIDILIDGPYIREIPQAHPWAGSGNQRILCLQDGEIIFHDTAPPASAAMNGEITIAHTGAITLTGFFS